MAKQQQPEDIVKTTSVVGVNVKSIDKATLGKIEDIMIDKLSGNVRYVVLSFGGILGLGEKLFALPWRAISYSPEEEAFIVKYDKEIFKEAPGFSKDHWPDMADPMWEKTIQAYYKKYDKTADKTHEMKKDIKKSGEDWLQYVETHPLQSVLFGIIGYFALRGIRKSTAK